MTADNAAAPSATDNATRLLDLARAQFHARGGLSPAEEELLRAAANGELADYRTGNAEADDPAKVQDWGDDRKLRADRIAWLCTDRPAAALVTHRGVRLAGARIEGELDLNHARIPFPLWLEQSLLKDTILLRLAHLPELSLEGTHTRGMHAEGLKVEGGVFLSEGFRAEGEVRLLGAAIRGDLSCIGGQFINPRTEGDKEERRALNADRLKVEGGVFLREGFRAEGEVRLLGASIGGNLECDGGQFVNPRTEGDKEERRALNADGLKVEGSVFLRKGFRAQGEVRLLGASIGGNLECDGGQFINPAGYALSADRLKVEGGVYLRQDFRAEGEVRLLRASIGGDIDCAGGQFINPRKEGDKEERRAINADGLKVEGGAFLREGFRAEGQVRLLGASIGGDLDCDGGQFINQAGYALGADGLKVEGSVFLREGFRAEGRVSLAAATIHLVLEWRGVKDPEMAILDLRSARVGTLWDQEASWPKAGNLFLYGLEYAEIYHKGHTHASRRLDWLRRQPQKPGQFFPQPYEHLAEVLRKEGHEGDAREVLIGKNEDRAKYARMGRPERVVHWVLGKTIRYGYRPWRAFHLSLIVIAFGILVFGAAHRAGVMRPTSEKTGAVEAFNAVMYSIDVFLPIVDFYQETGWRPETAPPWGWLVRYYLWFHITAGWVLTTLWVAGLSGLVKQ